MLFHKIDGASIILLSKGVYRQVDAYQRNGELFARWGNGFIPVRYSGFGGQGTSLPHVNVVHIEGPFTFPAKGYGTVKISEQPVARAA